jgi:putative transposase
MPLEKRTTLPQRHRPAKGVLISSQSPTVVFLTVCTANRAPWLATTKAHTLLLDAWKAAQAWLVGPYVLMPDHLHLFCSPSSQILSLENWIRYWKRLFTIAANEPTWLWQSHHWDRRMRTPLNYRKNLTYMRENPVRKGLSSTPETWLYSGNLNTLRW